MLSCFFQPPNDSIPTNNPHYLLFFSTAFRISSIQSIAASSRSRFAVVSRNRFMYSMFVKRFGFFVIYSRISSFFSSASEKYYTSLLPNTPHVVEFACDRNRCVEREKHRHDLRAAHAALLQRVDDRRVHLLHGQARDRLLLTPSSHALRASAASTESPRDGVRGAPHAQANTTPHHSTTPSRS